MSRQSLRSGAMLSATLFLFLAGGVLGFCIEFVGRAEVIDGDTLVMDNVELRLNGVDAAEPGQSCNLPGGGEWDCATAAADRLAELTTDRELACVLHKSDHYGRLVVTCLADGIDPGETLVAEGLAWAFVEYSDVYVEQESRARDAGAGIWQAPTQAPWDYRADRWERAAEASPRPGCPIKGNIAQDGERIYHTPWSPSYEPTKISEGKGERWFCDEAEAVEAGWRAARSR